MADPSPGQTKHGVPSDAAIRKKIRQGLSDQEKQHFDEVLRRIDAGKKPDPQQRKFIRKLKQQGKIKVPSKSFRSRSDKKTHQEP